MTLLFSYDDSASRGLPAGVEVSVEPSDAGWTHAGLQVRRLAAGEPQIVRTGECEMFVLPLAGSLDVAVAASASRHEIEARFHLEGRDSVFSRVTDFAYVGRDSVIELVSDQDAEVALPSARCGRRLTPVYGPAQAVPVEVRGAGNATRQVTNFGSPSAWDHADRLICCELITPAGNWSSYPPHKHDLTRPCTVANEEIYYYRIAGADSVTPSRTGYGLHVTSTGPEHDAAGFTPLDERILVRDGDVVVVPYGYHGPCAAAPGYDMYYLNVLAGPGELRSMAFCDHADHAWVRTTWNEMTPDPRCPVTSAEGRVAH